MSLTSHLNQSNDPIRHLLLETLPPAEEWRLSSGDTFSLVAPPNPALQRGNEVAVGTGFDAYARILAAQHYRSSASDLCSSFLATKAEFYLPDWYRTLSEKALKALPKALAKGGDEKTLGSIACLLGRGDALIHSNFKADTPAFEEKCRHEDPLILEEVLRLGRLYQQLFFDRYPTGKNVVFNPIFDFTGRIGGADGDLIVEGNLLDFKTTSNFAAGRLELAKAQVWGYLLLDRIGMKEGQPQQVSQSLCLYFARAGLFLGLDLAKIKASYIEACASKLDELLN